MVLDTSSPDDIFILLVFFFPFVLLLFGVIYDAYIILYSALLDTLAASHDLIHAMLYPFFVT
jgi:hypothetical protein